jgi:hypothetical protein
MDITASGRGDNTDSNTISLEFYTQEACEKAVEQIKKRYDTIHYLDSRIVTIQYFHK